MKHYTTTSQTGSSLPGDLIPPGGRGWELFSFAERQDGYWLVAWVREEKPCPECRLGTECRLYGCHKPFPHCSQCRGSGWVAA